MDRYKFRMAYNTDAKARKERGIEGAPKYPYCEITITKQIAVACVEAGKTYFAPTIHRDGIMLRPISPEDKVVPSFKLRPQVHSTRATRHHTAYYHITVPREIVDLFDKAGVEYFAPLLHEEGILLRSVERHEPVRPALLPKWMKS